MSKTNTPFRNLTLYLLAIILIVSTTLQSQVVPVRSRPVAPGVVHNEYELPGPFTLDVLEMTLGNPYIRFESYRPNGLVRTTLQASANDREGHRVIGAVNADFFSFETGWPTGNQVVNGTFVLGVDNSRSHLAIDSTQRPFIDRLAFQGSLIGRGGAVYLMYGANVSRYPGTLIFYTTYYGATTATNSSGVECTVQFLSPQPTACDTVRARVSTKASEGNMAIPQDGGVLSGGYGTAATFLTNNLQVGDTVSLVLGFDAQLRRITQVLGGAGRILLNGRDVSDSMAVVEGIGTPFTRARNPRTFFAFNIDTTKVYLCTVDGRQASSLGMTFGEMSGFLRSIGAWNAFNFDGGGSTTMVVRGQVVNSPSDPGGERSVANSLQVVSTAPTGTLHVLDLQPKRAELFQGETLQFAATGIDEYYNPVTLPGDIIWEAQSRIGTISSSGLLSAKTGNDSGWVKVRWNSVIDSAFIVTRTLSRIIVSPSSIIMVPGEQVAMLVQASDSEGRKLTLQNSQVSFLTSSPAMNVNMSGQATATDFGSGILTVTLDTLTSTVPFAISAVDTAVTIDRFNSLFNWEPALINTDTQQVHVSLSREPSLPDTPAVRISYAYSPRAASVVLNCLIPIAGRLDSIFIRVLGDGNADTIRLQLRDKDGQLFSVDGGSAITWKDEWRTVGFRLNRAVPVAGGTVDYPVTLTQLRVDLGNLNNAGGMIQGELVLDDLGAHYPLRTVTPQLLFDFENGITGWLTPQQSNAAQLKGIDIAASTLIASAEKAYQGSFSGKWTFVDDPGSTVDWDVRMTRNQNADLGSMLRGSYVGAWVYADGPSDTELQIAIRDGNGQICAGPQFPVRHFGWKLIGTRLDENLFSPYLTSGKITDAGNKFNGFRLRASNAAVSGKTKILYIDKLVTSALTVPTGFVSFTATWNTPLARLRWSVNSEISISRYVVERGTGGTYSEIGALQGKGNIDTTVEYEYVDTPPEGPVYQYRVRQLTNDGAQEVSPVNEINTGTNSVGPHGEIPDRFELYQNYPNPFNPTTIIGIGISDLVFVSLRVYDMLGRGVATLVNEVKKPGTYTVQFDASRLSSGTYFYRMEALDFVQVKKMLVLK